MAAHIMGGTPAVYADPSPWAYKQLDTKVAAEDGPRQR